MRHRSEYYQSVMRRLLALLVLLLAPESTSAQAPDAWFGTWTLNVAKSTYSQSPPPYKRGTFVVEPRGDGVRLITELVGARGGITHYEWDGRFDGKDYPVQGIDEVLTYAYTLVDARTATMTIRADGRLVARARATISPDGRTLTTETSGTNVSGETVMSRTVYEKVEK